MTMSHDALAKGAGVEALTVEAAEEQIARARASSERQQALFHELIDRCPFGIYIVDSDFCIASMNRGSQDGAFINVRPVIGRPFEEAMHILWPPDVAEEIIRRFRHTLDTGEPFHSRDFVRPRSDTGEVEGYEWELHRTTLPDGRPGVICYYFDSTELRQMQRSLQESLRRQSLLTGELNHRVKNSLAIVQALAHQSFRAGDVPAAARSAFEGRLQTLANAHGILSRNEWEPAELQELVASAFKACGFESRYLASGPKLHLDSSAAVTMALALHELCTNAVKYGALSNDTGTVEVSWSFDCDDDHRFRFEWAEVGGPAVSPPQSKGFGSRLIERALAGQLNAAVSLDFNEAGLRCSIDAPAAAFSLFLEAAPQS